MIGSSPHFQRLRWLAVSIFAISSLLNYLDRSLQPAVAPSLMGEFHLSNYEYGQVIFVFSIVYAVAAPLAGWFIDRVGLNGGISIAALVWSAASVATGVTHSFGGLIASRALLGIAEAAGVPAYGKANAMYLAPRELALGTAVNQVGISLGLAAAPLIVARMAPYYGWRSAFIVCGALGLVWVPMWLLTSKRIPASAQKSTTPHLSMPDLLRDRRLWGLVLGTVFIMSLYTLWTNWTTVYFVTEWHLSQEDANRRFAWIPPILGTAGGFAGGWMAFHWIRGGMDVMAARMRVCWICATVACLATAAVPFAPTMLLGNVAISLSAFWAICASTNLYAMPIDMFGAGRAAFGVSMLTFAYGLMQAFFSLGIGKIVDHVGFPMVCLTMAALPLIGVAILRVTTRAGGERIGT
jgi:ACS family hexuronate transporter-like MFS transporter